ncbi:septum formation initiator family protein [Pseudarthrobacter sp. PS3-L1]|uniref:FtsB family cell division protein n=1 Tax=Pseudarthrobacter sp. PS3-L1 TaxID=3046207 RepID=UPI0024B99AF3|nr:septum formation initiator family protein [Pseudarthrobacter sp. PS3-L1]MDJ0319593.1 septum formation initiator family protein [Pseudarthrobacter sp. PS3-L1]
MATRRPHVPRVTPSRKPAAEEHQAADVIRADFGHAAAGKISPAGRSTTAGSSGPTVQDQSAGREQASGGGKAAGLNAGQSAVGRSGGKELAVPTGKSVALSAPQRPQGDADGPVPAKGFSGRMLALAVVMIAITIMLAPTVKIFLDKRAEISALNADIAARQEEQAGLNQQISRWQDPNYVKQQARDRINMVMPGETSYWVFGTDGVPAEDSSEAAAPSENPANTPWVDAMWQSITRSGTD